MRDGLVLRQNMTSKDSRKSMDLSTEKHTKKKNWRSRITFLLKRSPSSLQSNQRPTDSYRPTVDDVNLWAQSLDKLLAHTYGKAAFYIFLKSEFCEENIEFWTACEDFRTIRSTKELNSRANSIFEEFIRCEAPKEINLDFHTRNAVVEGLHQPSENSFLVAQKKIYSLMENNSYPRFINSDLYKELCAGAKGKKKTKN